MEERLEGLEKKLKSMTAMLWVILLCTSMTFGFVFKKLNTIQDNVDFDERKVMINGQKGQSKRFLPMNQTLFELFTEIKDNDPKTPFNFNPDYITKKIAKYYKSAKIKGANPHSLRKTFGSLLIQNKKADIYTVSKLLGHLSVRTTEKYYVDLIDDNYKAAVDGLDDLI